MIPRLGQRFSRFLKVISKKRDEVQNFASVEWDVFSRYFLFFLRYRKVFPKVQNEALMARDSLKKAVLLGWDCFSMPKIRNDFSTRPKSVPGGSSIFSDDSFCAFIILKQLDLMPWEFARPKYNRVYETFFGFELVILVIRDTYHVWDGFFSPLLSVRRFLLSSIQCETVSSLPKSPWVRLAGLRDKTQRHGKKRIPHGLHRCGVPCGSLRNQGMWANTRRWVDPFSSSRISSRKSSCASKTCCAPVGSTLNRRSAIIDKLIRFLVHGGGGGEE